MAYSLGAVKPHVAAAANEMGPRFGITNIGGFSFRNIAGTNTLSDHARGLALDFMTTSKSRGDALAAYAQSNAGRLGVTYIIWWRRIWSVARANEGWRPYSGGSPHTDHVHVSFSSSGGNGNATPIGIPPILPPINPWDKDGPAGGLGGDITGSISALSQLFSFFTNPGTWVRVAMFTGGLVILLVAITMIIRRQGAGEVAKSVTNTIGKSNGS